MKTPEDAVNDAVTHPISRLMILLIGSLQPIPETIYGLIVRPEEFHEHWWEGVTRWFDFEFIPVLGGMVS